MSKNPKNLKPPRRRRKLLAWLFVSVLLVAGLVAIAPTLVNLGVGQGVIRSRLEQRVNGTLALGRLDVGWLGPQSVDGLEVTGDDGRTTARLDVRIEAGLLGLLTGRVDPIEVVVSGALSGELRRDGSTSFEDLFASRPSVAPRAARAAAAPPRKPLSGVPPATVRLDGLTVELRSAEGSEGSEGSEVIVLGDLSGTLAYRPGGRIAVEIDGTTGGARAAGAVKVTADVTGLFDADGVLSIAGASGSVTLALSNIAVPFAGRPTELTALLLRASAADVTERIELTVEADALIDGSVSGRLEGAITAEKAVRPDGSLDLGLDRLRGRITGRSVPTVLFQRALPEPLIAVRDLGPTIDLQAEFSASRVDVSVSADSMKLAMSGTVDPQQRSIEGDRLSLRATLHPELVSAATSWRLDRPTVVRVELDRFEVPPLGCVPVAALLASALAGTVAVDGPAVLGRPGDGPMLIELADLVVAVDTEALGDGGRFDGSATVDGAEVTFDFTLADLLDGDNKLALATMTPAGKAEIKGLAPATLARLLDHEGWLDAVRDPVDVMLVTAGEPDRLQVELAAKTSAGGDRNTLLFSGTVDPAPLSISEARLSFTGVVPAKLAGRAKGLEVDRPLHLQVEITRLVMPPPDPGLAHQLRRTAVTGMIAMTSPVSIARPGEAPLFELDNLFLDIDTPGLVRGGTVKGTASIDRAAITFDLNLEGLFDETGALTLSEYVPEGTFSVQKLRPATLARLLDQPRIESVTAEAVNVALVAALRDGEHYFSAEVSGPDLELEMRGTRRGATLHVVEASGWLEVTDELLAELQAGSERRVALAASSRVSFDLEPFEMSLRPPNGESPLPPSLAGRLFASDSTFTGVPGLAEPLRVRYLSANVDAQLGEIRTVSAQGRARLFRGELWLAQVEYELAARKADAVSVDRVTLGMTKLSIIRLEPMLGWDAGAISSWTGDAGALALEMRPASGGWTGTIRAEFPHLAGAFTATADGETVSVTADATTLSLAREGLQRRLAPQPGGVRVEADVPLTLDIRTLRLPRGLLTGEPFDPSAAVIDCSLTGGPLVLRDPAAGRNEIRRMAISLHSDDLGDGLDVTVSGELLTPPGTRTTPIEIEGRLSRLMSDDGTLALKDAKMDLGVSVRGIHTSVPDALFNLKGMLVAAVGPAMDLTLTSSDFSRTSGRLHARVDTPNGWLEMRGQGVDNALWVPVKAPLQAELEITPELGKRLLTKIHPLLGDVRSAKDPMRVTAPGLAIPLDGDTSRFRGDVNITIGEVAFDSGSATLGVLAIFDPTRARTIPGYIEPIELTIRQGVITYDRFVVRIDKFSIPFSGTVDLNTKTYDVHWEFPLEGLAGTFHELEPVKDVIVPLWTHGTFGNYETDFEDLEGTLLEAGLKSILDKVFK